MTFGIAKSLKSSIDGNDVILIGDMSGNALESVRYSSLVASIMIDAGLPNDVILGEDGSMICSDGINGFLCMEDTIVVGLEDGLPLVAENRVGVIANGYYQ